MSADNGTAPASAKSGFSVWTLVRIAGIIVGIATLLRVATNEKLVTYDPLFQQWLDIVSEFIDLAFLTQFIGPLLQHGIDYVRNFGIHVPDLQDEWRTAYILSMLMFGKLARHSRGWWALPAALLGALVVAVWSGLIGYLAPVAFAALAATFATTFARSAAAISLGRIVVITLVTVTVTAAAAAFTFAVSTAAAVAAAAVLAVAAVTAVAALLLFHGIVEGSSGGWRAIFANPSFNMGIDILGVMLGALGFASLFANPSIW